MKTFSKNDTLAIRGIAIVLLIFHHNFRSKSVYEGFTCSFFPFSEDKVVLFCNFLKICVGMFAFLSAYGLTLSLKKYNKNSVLTGRQYSHFLSNRIFNLLWGFWFIFIPCEIINWFVAPQYTLVYFTHGMVQGSVNVLLDFLGIAKLFGTPQLNGTWWYMSLAIVILMVVPFMSKLCEKYNSFCVTLFLLALPRIMSLAFSLKVGEDSNCFRWMFAALLGVMAAKYNVSVPQLCIRYTLQLGTISLPKTANPAHMESNAQVDFEIGAEDMELLKHFKHIESYGKSGGFPVYGDKL